MLTEPLYQALQDLGLRGMARAFATQEKESNRELNFNERLALLIDAEQSERRNYRYAQRVRWAKLGQSPSHSLVMTVNFSQQDYYRVLNNWLSEGKLRIIVEKIYATEEYEAMYVRSASSRVVGKLVYAVGDRANEKN